MRNIKIALFSFLMVTALAGCTTTAINTPATPYPNAGANNAATRVAGDIRQGANSVGNAVREGAYDVGQGMKGAGNAAGNAVGDIIGANRNYNNRSVGDGTVIATVPPFLSPSPFLK